jgi:hypothetical protein
MVSNVLHIPRQELVDKLLRFRTEYADDPDYQAMREPFPAEWPM